MGLAWGIGRARCDGQGGLPFRLAVTGVGILARLLFAISNSLALSAAVGRQIGEEKGKNLRGSLDCL